MIFDTHAHYDDPKFSELEGGVDGLLTKLFSGEVKYIINAGTDLDTCRRSMRLAESYSGMYFTCGIHPSECGKYNDIDETLEQMEAMLRHPKCVGLGEIGLDYHYDTVPREVQMRWFVVQLILAAELKKPVVIHDRDAHGDCVSTLLRYGVRGVMHSCSESAEDAKRLTDHGFYISFSGSVTFKNASNVARCAASIPDERLLVETDCPYLAPTPHRGELNHSGNIKYTAQTLAELRGVSYEHICDVTYRNARCLFLADL